MRTNRMWLVGFIAVGLVACSSSEAGEECKETKDCADGLVCPKSGAYYGHCTAECEDSGHCATVLGSEYFCYFDGVCVKQCTSGDSSCGSGMSCSTQGPYPHCSAD